MEVRNKYISGSYTIKTQYDAGIVLSGPEVKSCKYGNVQFKGSFCSFDGPHLVLKDFFIAPYPPAKREQVAYNPKRSRRLLLNKKELNTLIGKVHEKGVSIVPIRLYTHNRMVKMCIGLGIGLKKFDKREKIKAHEFKRRRSRLVSA